MFGSVNEWLYRSLLGINAGSPGFKTIIIKPQPPNGLSFARGSFHSVYGLISSNWTVNGKSFYLNVDIPVNTRAEIWLPGKDIGNISEGGKQIQQVNDIKLLRVEDGYTVITTGSGNYSFESELYK